MLRVQDVLLLPYRALETVAGLSPQFERLNDVLDDLSAEVRAVRTDLGFLQATIDAMARDVEPVDTDLHEVTRAVERMAPQLEEVVNHIDLLRTDLSGLPFVGRR